jgi:hypothetical protein
MLGFGPGFGSQVQDNLADANLGTLVTNHSTVHTKGSYSTLLTAGFEAFGFSLFWHSASSPGVNSSMLLDIAINTGGGDVVILPNFLVGYSGNRPPSCPFPLLIPSGAVVKARSQGAISAGTIRVGIYLWGGSPTVAGPWGLDHCVAYGVNTGTSDGTAVAGGQGAKGSWVTIDAASDADHPTIAAAIQVNGSTATGTRLKWMADIGDGSTVWHSNLLQQTDSAEYVMGPWPSIHAIREHNIPSGTLLRARAASQSTTPANRTRTVALYGSVAA